MYDPLLERTGLSPDVIRYYNSRIADLFSLYLNAMPEAVDAETVRELAADCHIPTVEAYAHYLAALFRLDEVGEDRVFFQYWLKPALHALDPAPYTADAYFQNIRIPEQVLGRWELKREELAPFEAFVATDFIVTPDRRLIPQIGFFDKPYPFPAVLENGREWMTLLPNEMVTTQPAIKEARGRVLTYGLGLGYFAYHASEKKEVSSVTVVDLSPDVIALFREHILPQFPHKEKIVLVESDAFTFADTKMAGNFDFVFGDIWHDAGDGRELYLRMKEWETRFPDIRFSFWLEDTIRCYLDRELWNLPKE